MQPPYLVGMTCGFCHIGFNPIRPPADPERPAWANLAATIGNQYWEEGKLFSLNMKPDDFRWHVAARQPAGTSDTSRFATDHINNPNAINTIFNLAARPTEPERQRDGSMLSVPHILKDGADSVGVAGASLRVYVNIGMCGEYWVTRQDPVLGIEATAALRDRVRAQELRGLAAHGSADGERRKLPEADEAALAEGRAGRRQYLSTSADTLRTGRRAFAETARNATRATAARRHGRSCSMVPHGGRSPGLPVRQLPVRRQAVFDHANRHQHRPVAGQQRHSRQHLGHFSSETYKELPSVGSFAGLYNPRDPEKPIPFEMPAGGRGYIRMASLTSIWATAPFLHNNSVGVFVKDPSVQGRMTAFNDAIVKMLWPERRLGVQSIPVTTVESSAQISGSESPRPHPRRHAGGLCGSRRSDAAARHHPQQLAAQFLLDESIYRRMRSATTRRPTRSIAATCSAPGSATPTSGP